MDKLFYLNTSGREGAVAVEDVFYLREMLTKKLNVQEVARLTGLSRTTIHNALRHGKPVRKSVADKLRRVLSPTSNSVEPSLQHEIGAVLDECERLGGISLRLIKKIEEAAERNPSLILGLELPRQDSSALAGPVWKQEQLRKVGKLMKNLETFSAKAHKALSDVRRLHEGLAKYSNSGD